MINILQKDYLILYIRPSHATTETTNTKQSSFVHTHYNFFLELQWFFSLKHDLEINDVGPRKTFIVLQTWDNSSSFKHHKNVKNKCPTITALTAIDTKNLEKYG